MKVYIRAAKGSSDDVKTKITEIQNLIKSGKYGRATTVDNSNNRKKIQTMPIVWLNKYKDNWTMKFGFPKGDKNYSTFLSDLRSTLSSTNVDIREGRGQVLGSMGDVVWVKFKL